MYFLDERAGRIADIGTRSLKAAIDTRADSVGADDDGSIGGRFYGRVYHPNALFLKIFYNDRVMYQGTESSDFFPLSTSLYVISTARLTPKQKPAVFATSILFMTLFKQLPYLAHDKSGSVLYLTHI